VKRRVTLEQSRGQYVDSVVVTAALYEIAWNEHKEFVPNTNGGHDAFQANGIFGMLAS
jgi:hypothetical protein